MKQAEEQKQLTDAELLVLGLVAEMPRHGYELEQEIERRRMREWAQIGFSSLYFVLGKLQSRGLLKARKPVSSKAKKTFAITAKGKQTLTAQALGALRTYKPAYPSVLLGMAHWELLLHDEAVDALAARRRAVDGALTRLRQLQVEQQPLPDCVEALFDFSIGQLQSEASWTARTLDYMKRKPRLK